MKKSLLILKIIFFVISSFFILGINSYAQEEDNWTLIPEWDASAASEVSNAWPGKVWEKYNEKAQNITPWDSFASWVFSWNSVFAFFKYLAKTLSGIWLVIWAAMIIYAGYKYATWVFTWDAAKWWQDALKWAIYWVLIVIFSYAIMKILIGVFL